MSRKIYPVCITFEDKSNRYPAEFQTLEEHKKEWKAALKAVYKTPAVVCCCYGIGPKQLAVRYYEKTDTFGLAKYGDTGDEHFPNCNYFALAPAKSGIGAYDSGVIDEQEDGTFKIKLGIGLSIKEPATGVAVSNEPLATGTASRKQPAMRLLGMLHLLWTTAELNVWWPAFAAGANENLINSKLRIAAERIVASGLPLSSVLLLLAPNNGSKQAVKNSTIVSSAAQQKRRLLVVATLRTFKAGHDVALGKFLPISNSQGMPGLLIDDIRWRRTLERFPRVLTGWRQGEKVVVICQVELCSNTQYANVIDLALMQVTGNWIPVDSSYEKVIANKLTVEQRAFSKPLRHDADASEVFPDFILLDTQHQVPLEVFGRSDEAYVVRQAVKTTYYQKHFGTGNWWCWNAANDPTGVSMTAFPPASRDA